MLLILLGIIAWGTAAAGWGLYAGSRVGVQRVRIEDAMWLGIAALSLLAGMWNLLLPADGLFAAMAIAAGVVCLLLNRGNLDTAGVRGAGVLAFAAVAMALYGLRSDFNPDSGAYHFPAMEWFRRGALLPGLANVIPHFAFQSAHFVWLAGVDSGPFSGIGHHIAHPLLLGIALVGSLTPLLRGQSICLEERLAGLLTLIPWVDQLVDRDGVSGSPDLPVTLAGLASARLIARSLFDPEVDARSDARRLLVVVGAMGVAMKLSFALGALVIAWALILEFASGRRDWRLVAFPVAAACLVLVRGVLLSGWPLYPLPWLGVPVDWALPVDEVIRIREYVTAWGRASGAPMGAFGGFDWLQPWAIQALGEGRRVVLPALLVLIGILGLARHSIRTLIPGRRGYLSVLAIHVVAMGVWLLGSPDLRFVHGTWWSLTVLLVLPTLSAMANALPLSGRRGVAVAIATLALLPLLDFRPMWGDGPEARTVPTTHDFATRSGIVLKVPTEGACLAAELPCSTFPARGLMLRVPGDPSRGFRRTPGIDDDLFDKGPAVIPRTTP